MSASVRMGSLGDRLAERLRLQIIRGELTPGTHLVEDLLAEQYDVSRGPVRDALAGLSREGLIERKRRGLFVRGFDLIDIGELYALRGALESLALTLAHQNASRHDWNAIEAVLGQMSAAADAGDWHVYAERDLMFHNEFYVLAANRRLQKAWQQCSPTFGTILSLTNEVDVDLHPSVEDHRALLEAARGDDLQHALTLLDAHLDGSRDRILRALGSSAAS